MAPPKKETPIQEQAGLALSYYARRFTVGLGPSFKRQLDRGIPLGSGVLAHDRNRTYVLTADHVLTTIGDAGFHILFAPDCGTDAVRSPKEVKALLEKTPTSKMEKGQELVPRGIIRERESLTDIAALEIDPGIIPAWCHSINLESETHLNPRKGERLYIFGLPNDFALPSVTNGSHEVSVKSGTAVVPVDVSGISKPSLWKEDDGRRAYFQRLHYLLKPTSLDHRLEGMSGGGIWKLRQLTFQGQDLWNPELKLAGIQSSFHKTFDRAKATRVEYVLQLLGVNNSRG